MEKALKSYFITERRDVPPKTHNLLDLSRELDIPKEFLTIARELTPEFVITRYPNAAGGPPVELYDEKSAAEILGKAERFFKWIRSRTKG